MQKFSLDFDKFNELHKFYTIYARKFCCFGNTWSDLGKPAISAQQLKSTFCLYMKITPMNYPETPNT